MEKKQVLVTRNAHVNDFSFPCDEPNNNHYQLHCYFVRLRESIITWCYYWKKVLVVYHVYYIKLSAKTPTIMLYWKPTYLLLFDHHSASQDLLLARGSSWKLIRKVTYLSHWSIGSKSSNLYITSLDRNTSLWINVEHVLIPFVCQRPKCSTSASNLEMLSAINEWNGKK